VVVVNQLFASMVFGSQDPIGQRVALNFSNPAHDAEIVGVVATIRHGGPAAAEAPEVYAPAAQTPLPRYTVLLRTNIEPQSLFTAIAREVHRADRDVAVAVPTRWSDAVEARFAVHQVRLALVMALAAIAMLLAGLSAFGTVGEMVNARTREFAVRIALGAAPSSLVGTGPPMSAHTSQRHSPSACRSSRCSARWRPARWMASCSRVDGRSWRPLRW
jgi:hypothetical protein